MRKGDSRKTTPGAHIRKAGEDQIWVVGSYRLGQNEDGRYEVVGIRPLGDENGPSRLVPAKEILRDWRCARPCDYDYSGGCEGCQLRGICRSK